MAESSEGSLADYPWKHRLEVFAFRASQPRGTTQPPEGRAKERSAARYLLKGSAAKTLPSSIRDYGVRDEPRRSEEKAK